MNHHDCYSCSLAPPVPRRTAGRGLRWRRIAALLVFGLGVGGAPMNAAAFTEADADTLFAAHSNAFYRVDDEGRAWFRETTRGGKASFWMRAEQMEMVLDAYERSRRAELLEMFTRLFHGFIADHGADWTGNDFNDDIMWMVIACTRAYRLTRETAFLDAARANFDACYARAWSDDLGGGLWWKTDNRSKNACVNGPAAIAAALLAEACGEEAYAAKARRIFEWLRATLYDAETGRVFDNVRLEGEVNRMVFSYNLGTFVGAAHLLGFPDEARRAATYTMNELSRDGLLPNYGERGDGGGFNGICARWIARYMYARGLEDTFEPWLRGNATAAWRVRRAADNLSWCRWTSPTPPGTRHSFGCSSSVVILQVVRPDPVSPPPKLGTPP